MEYDSWIVENIQKTAAKIFEIALEGHESVKRVTISSVNLCVDLSA